MLIAVRRVFGSWRMLHGEDLHKIYSRDVIRVIKSRLLRWTGFTTYGRDEKCVQNVSLEKSERKYHLKGFDVDARVILYFI